MGEEFERKPGMGEENLQFSSREAVVHAISDILDSATSSYREAEGRSIACSIALAGNIFRDDISGLAEEMPVVADIALAKDPGDRAFVLFDISTATRLANYITSGNVAKDLAAGGQHISSLRNFLVPLVEAFSAACEAAAGKTFGSLQKLMVCDRNERELLMEYLSDEYFRIIALVSAGGEPAGRMAIVIPSGVADSLADSKGAPSRISVSQYERMELEEVNDGAASSVSSHLRGPSMENIDLIMDIQLKLSARLGQVEMPIGDIVKLAPGSVIDIDRLVDEPIELVVNDRLIARGEIVVVQENFGIKITEIISKKDRIQSLG